MFFSRKREMVLSLRYWSPGLPLNSQRLLLNSLREVAHGSTFLLHPTLPSCSSPLLHNPKSFLILKLEL